MAKERKSVAPGFETRLKEAKESYERRNGTGPLGDKAFAEVCGISKQLLFQYLGKGDTKKTNPSSIIVLKMSRRLGVSPYWFVLDEGKMTNGIEPLVGDKLTSVDERFRVFLMNKNPAYRELAEAFVRGVRALGPLSGWVGNAADEKPRTPSGIRNGTNNRTSGKDKN